ncbi:MAG: efflux RND transporter permease subunit [Cyclobacteriaceae bacterium]
MVRFLVNRPIGTTMVFIAIAALGILAGSQLPVSLMPDIEIPEITIQATHEVYNSEQIEESILRPLRNELLQTQHLDVIHSMARNGSGIISLRFNYGTDISKAAIEVNEKIDAGMNRLPEGVRRPTVIKASAVDLPVFTINVSLKGGVPNEEKLLELSTFAEQVLKRRIEQVPEVALVDMTGRVYPEIRITMDTSRVIQLGISVDQITRTISENNREFGNILIREGHYQYNVKIGNRLINIEDLNNLLINSNGRLFRLGELARLETVPVKTQGLYDANGWRALAMAVIKKSDARLEDMSLAVRETLELLEQDYPDLTFEITRDQSRLLEVTLVSLKNSLMIGSLLAFFVMFLFLRDLRSPLLIGISIPVSLIVSLLGFYWVGLTVNMVSLSGLLLGIGLMIDNSIIVIDNISQWNERGSSLKEACINGAEEVIRPLISSVLTTCAVFVPLIFLSGISGALFYDQALAVSIGLVSSLVVSTTLIPVYFRILKQNKRLEKWNNVLQFRQAISLSGIYKRGYEKINKHQPVMVILLIIVLAAIYPLYLVLEKQRFPDITESATQIHLDWNENIHVDENRKRLLELVAPISDKLIQHNSEIGQQQFILSGNFSAQTPNESSLYLLAKDAEQLPEIQENIRHLISIEYPRASIKFSAPKNAFERLFDSGESPFVARIVLDNASKGDNPLEILKPIHVDIAGSIPDFQPLAVDRVLNISLNHEKILLYDMEIDQVIQALKTLLDEQVIGELRSFQQYTPIKVGTNDQDLLYQLEHLELEGREGNVVPLRLLVNTYYEERLKTIHAGKDGVYFPFDFQITSDEIDGFMQTMNALVRDFDANVEFSGSLIRNQELIGELAMVMLVSIILLYFILAAQFESMWQPVIILLEVPMNFTACFLGLYLTGSSLNIMSLIGIIVMSGVIVNDSILKIDTINQLRNQGYATDEAIKLGGERRLKPILMTSLTTILALVPFLVAGDLGSELQRPLAITVICGMLSGTFVSLYYIPLFYGWVVGSRRQNSGSRKQQ